MYVCAFGYILTRLGMFAMFGCIWVHLGKVEYNLLYLRCMDTFGYIWVPMDICGYMWCIYIYIYRCIYVIYIYIYLFIQIGMQLCVYIYTPLYNTTGTDTCL